MAKRLVRAEHVREVLGLLRWQPVVALLGPRQVGKTTLAREVLRAWKGRGALFDLEDPEGAAALADPLSALRPLRGLVVLDEVQNTPEIFRILRVLADRERGPARFLVLGSASPALLRQTSESLAGRITFHRLGGFDLSETGAGALPRLWLRGGFPDSFLAPSEARSFRWRQDFVSTFLQRDVPQFGVSVPAPVLRRFWTMVAHSHGQVWNASGVAQSLGVSVPTVQRYLDLLEATFMVRVLRPWHENLSKRQVKAPKVYVSDPGILHALLSLRTSRDVASHPKAGASWEGFLVGEIVRRLRADPGECHFWATHAGAELDLLIVRGRRRLGFEIKRTSAPAVTASMRIAMQDLRLERLDVVHAGDRTFPLAKGIRAVPAGRILEELAPFRGSG